MKEFGRVFKLMVIVVLLSKNLYCQNYEKSPIAISDIIRGIDDFEYMRAVFIEKGFKFDRRDSESEFWKVQIDDVDDAKRSVFSQLTIQLSTWKLDGQVFRKVLYINIRKDLLANYNEVFLKQVASNFPEKRSRKVIRTVDGVSKEDYDLVYYSQNLEMTVEYSEDDRWIKYSFCLDIKEK